jgi:anaerobic ribonucleoside-triphosphate reductase
MTTYEELMMRVDAFHELRQKIRNELSAHPETSGGEILDMENDPDTGDLLVTWEHESGQRVHQLIFRDVTPGG